MLTFAASASAIRRSLLGSASPRSHLRKAEGETPIVRASRSALGQWRRIVRSRPVKALRSAPWVLTPA